MLFLTAFTVKQFIWKMEEEIINIKIGEERIIKLKGLSSAGYTWVLDDSGQNIFTNRKEIFFAGRKKQDIDAASAEEHFHIKAIASGEVKLVFQQKREWQKGKAPNSVRNITVK